MQFSLILMAAGLTTALPTIPGLPTYINSVTNVANAMMAGTCDVSTMSQPAAATTQLPSPVTKLALVAIGKGTQNYTCPEPANPTAVPTAIGAMATLYNASCLADHSSSEEMGFMVGGVRNLPAGSPLLAALPVVGHHYFSDMTTPTFDLSEYGVVHMKKNASTPAPTSDKNAVPWLYLKAVTGQDSKVAEVYRLETRDGAAPATCGTQTGAFTVEYSAEYWFYTSS